MMTSQALKGKVALVAGAGRGAGAQLGCHKRPGRFVSLIGSMVMYVGPWLPEPLIEEPSTSAGSMEDLADDASYALMLALERLSPLERAAFILHDVFDVGFDEVGAALGRSEAACRKLASRARDNARSVRRRFLVGPKEGERIAEAFFAASRSGDDHALRALLTESATLHSDGGGRKPAALILICGAGRVARFYWGLSHVGKTGPPRWSRRLLINGLPGWLTVERDGTLQTTAVEIQQGRICAVYVTRNPEKLGHLANLVRQTARTQ